MKSDSFTWLDLIDWIEKHPTFSSIVATVVLAVVSGVIVWFWNSARDGIKLKIQLKVEQFKLSTIGDERVLALLKFRIKILNRSKIPVGIQDFFLDMPDLGKETRFGLPVPINGLSFDHDDARMYANYFHLKFENGDHAKVPIFLDSPVIYLYGELNDHLLLKKLNGKSVRLVIIDQNSKEHSSNYFDVTDRKIIADLTSR